MSFISSFEIAKVVVPQPYTFIEPLHLLLKLQLLNPNNPSGFMTDFNNGSPVFNNGPRSLPENPPDRIIRDI